MNIIVTDDGFSTDNWQHGFGTPQAADLGSDYDPAALKGQLSALKMIRVDFPDFADGRGFSIARTLRDMGYRGRLRARGHILADQYAMARRAGFDEVEISPALARRQPEPQWLYRANWRAHDYQSRLRA